MTLPQHFLYFSPLPHEQGSLRPGFIFKRVKHPKEVAADCAKENTGL
jgi:hypothetical protein